MRNSEHYIGIRNGVVFCADQPSRRGIFRGRLYHGYREDGKEICSYEEMIEEMGSLFDEIQFPRPAMRDRSFREASASKAGQAGPEFHENQKERKMTDKDLLTKHGDIGTFIIRVQQRQNSTWQGRLTWVEHNETVHFRSMLEMIKLIESGIEENLGPEEDEAPAWEKE